MAIPITIPRLGWSMEEGTFVEWLKQDGDRIQPGDALFVLESDKSAEHIEALDAGTLRIPPDSPQPGATVKVGQVLAYLAAPGEVVPARKDEGGRMKDERSTVAGSSFILHPSSFPECASTPRARRVARELGVDCGNVQGSGRNGRIRERDVRAAAASPPPPARPGGELRGECGRLVPHTTLRRTIAARMVAGVTQAAPVTLTTKADATNLVNLRQQFKAAATSPDQVVPGYTDFLLKLTAAALRQHPLLQAQWRDDGLFIPENIHIALAVDAEDGLLAPVLRDVANQPLRQLAAASRELIALARAGRLTAEQMRDATFTLTNLGMFGVDTFTPIITLPQCAVLGVGRIVREPAVVDGTLVPRDVLTLSLTFDHRVVDGAPAARFLDTLRRCIEQPAPWLMP